MLRRNSKPRSVLHIRLNRVPKRDWDPEVKRKLLCLLGFVVVSIATVGYFVFNHSLHRNTSEFYIEHNIIAAMCTGVAAYLVLCLMLHYQRRHRIRPGMRRFCDAPQRQQERPDQRPEDIEMQENLVYEADPELGQQNREVMNGPRK
ncbi:hypothetical protein CDAR_19371 [Caerostris darwini]|uniref:Uncharacterized protein n=1 Tax=Caerostris darwini TaxID=1538125 RepID=A0AAV4WBD5_9ARAC|nr:hypothetical protein CDAR_19371 [Caerostris darwini]